jgi:oligopeptide/dipeptide ABC transporter ATP-binding protein
VSFDVRAGEVLAVVGESGCGKSVTAMALTGLLPPSARVTGRAELDGVDLAGAPGSTLRRVRGTEVAYVFQEPMNSLNPVFTVGRQVVEALTVHEHLGRDEAQRRAIELLDLVGIPDAQARLRTYPHQLSGGMRQRVMIAMALSCNPKVLIADEPTTALDVTIQAQILDLMRELQDTLGTAIILITHDMGVVAETADRVVVMYAGRKVEEAAVDDLFEHPGHPYTRGLFGSLPNLEVAARSNPRRTRLTEIKGMVPSLADLPQGCSFAPRCAFATDECRAAYPPLRRLRPGHLVACWHAERVMGGAA